MPNDDQKFIKKNRAGAGAYGIVYFAHDGEKDVAVKSHLKNHGVRGISCGREMGYSHKMNHPYVLSLSRITIGNPFNSPPSPIARGEYDRDKLYFVYDKAYCNLKEYLKHNRSTIQYLEIKDLMMEIMMGLEYIHGSGYMHLDFKPENILMFLGEDGRMHAKISDFGLATVYIPNHRNKLNVTTSWYRAPEICLGYDLYDQKVDTWAAGCTFYEMISGVPLFTDLSNEDVRILSYIAVAIPYAVDVKALAPYDKRGYSLIMPWKNSLCSQEKFFNLGEKFLQQMPSIGLYTLFDFMSKLLSVNPSKRMTAKEALDHPFFVNRKAQIQNIQSGFPYKSYPQEIIKIVNTNEPARQYAMRLVAGILDSKDIQSWCTLQILFHSIYMLDRVFYKALTEHSCNLIPIKDGHINITKDRSELYLISCIYMFAKHFTLIVSPIQFGTSFDRKYKTIECYNIFESLEFWITSTIYNYDIFEYTMYEEAFANGVTSRADLLSMCAFIIYGFHGGMTPAQGFKSWLQNKDKYIQLSNRLNFK